VSDIFKKLAEFKEENREGYLAIVIKTKGITSCRPGAKMIILPDGKIEGTIGGGEVEHEIISMVKRGEISKPAVYTFNLTGKDFPENKNAINLDSICGGLVEVFVEPIHTRTNLFIIGGGHCATELSALASKCGFFVIVADNRKDWASKEKHPFANKTIVCDYENLTATLKFKPQDFAVIMTSKHTYDGEVLEQLLETDLAYIGMMGSPHKIREIFNQLIENGVPEDKLKKVYAPIGFPIDSKTPAEIAVSITAQLIAVRNNLKSIRFSSNPLL